MKVRRQSGDSVQGYVYPGLGTKRTIRNLKSIGITLSREQAIEFAHNILHAALTDGSNSVSITGWRNDRRLRVFSDPTIIKAEVA